MFSERRCGEWDQARVAAFWRGQPTNTHMWERCSQWSVNRARRRIASSRICILGQYWSTSWMLVIRTRCDTSQKSRLYYLLPPLNWEIWRKSSTIRYQTICPSSDNSSTSSSRNASPHHSTLRIDISAVNTRFSEHFPLSASPESIAPDEATVAPTKRAERSSRKHLNRHHRNTMSPSPNARTKEESIAQGVETFGVSFCPLIFVVLIGLISFDISQALNRHPISVVPSTEKTQGDGILPAPSYFSESKRDEPSNPSAEGSGFKVGVSVDRNKKCRRTMEEWVVLHIVTAFTKMSIHIFLVRILSYTILEAFEVKGISLYSMVTQGNMQLNGVENIFMKFVVL